MKILGIVNITEDSFSDGGLYLNTDRAIAHALQLHRDGADIIDLGAASSNPKSGTVSDEEEIARLRPIIERLHAENITVSVDTFKPAVQRFCLREGVAYVNDIQGFPFPDLYPDLAQSDSRLIVMHSIQRIGMATVEETNPEEVFASMLAFFEQRVEALLHAGVSATRLVLDPGMGFFLGANPESSVLALKNIAVLKQKFCLPVLVGVSRKSFLGNIAACPPAERGAATLAAELFATEQGCDYIRTHDVRALRDGLAVWRQLN